MWDWVTFVVPMMVVVGILLFARKQGAKLAAERAIQDRAPLVPKDFWKVCDTAAHPPFLVWISRGLREGSDETAFMMDVLGFFQDQGWGVCILTAKPAAGPSPIPVFQTYQRTFVEIAVRRANWLIAEHGTIEMTITTAERSKKPVLIVAQELDIGGELELARSYTGVPQQILYTSKFLQTELGTGRHGFVVHPPFWPGKFKTHTSKFFCTLAPNATEEERDAFLEICSEAVAAAPRLQFLLVRNPALPELGALPANVTVWEPASRRAIFSETAVLLVPSTREVWGRIALEAAVAGIPTIAHPTESMKETMADAVQYRRVGNPAAWVSLLDVLLTQPVVYERLARAARREAEMRGTPAYELERLKLMLTTHGT